MKISRRPALETADCAIFAFLIGLWTLPWAALGVAMFAPWLAPPLFTPSNGLFSGEFLLYVADGLGMPLTLLLTGIRVVATSRGWWWLVAWIATVATGFAFQYATLPFLISMFRARDTLAGHWHWEALAWGGGFVLLAVVAGALLAGPPQKNESQSRTHNRKPTHLKANRLMVGRPAAGDHAVAAADVTGVEGAI